MSEKDKSRNNYTYQPICVTLPVICLRNDLNSIDHNQIAQS